MSHWLTPLLSPKTIAIVGASEREDSLATLTYRQLVETDYSGHLYLVNPKYEDLFGQTCYSSLMALPEVPDLVVFVISGLILEASFNEALDIGVGGIVIYANNYIEEDRQPPLTERLKRRAQEAGIPVCGGNSMGFYNYDDHVFVSFDRPPVDRQGGHIGLIVHSGSAMTYLGNNDSRFRYNYVIASSQETNATVSDYMDYLLEQDSTRVIAIFLETVRDVTGFVAALQKAQQKNIPVVITKLGRTEKSAALALSHSGAIVGDHDAFVSLCERYGVILAKHIDEMITTALLFSMDFRAEKKGISSLFDSGGMREQMIDLADDYGLEFAKVSDQTRSRMASYLEYGLEADNPLDAMGALGRDTGTTYLECGKALLDDLETGLLTYEFEFRDGFSHYPVMFDVIEQLAQYSPKPLIVINSCTFTDLTDTAASLCQKGIPVINGIDVALRAIRNLCSYQQSVGKDFYPAYTSSEINKAEEWRAKLKAVEECDESISLELMSDFGLPVCPWKVANNIDDAVKAAEKIAYPMVLKTAETGIRHKSDQGGVKLSLKNNSELEEAYLDLQSRLGNRVLIMPMAKSGVELALGMKNDSQYGPLIILAAGGILIELLKDRVVKLAPVDEEDARDMLAGLKITKLLGGVRGQNPADIDSIIRLIVQFSKLALTLSDSIQEIDLNPIIVDQTGCTIVDALVIPSDSRLIAGIS